MAAAVTAFDGQSSNITDPTIGELKFYYKKWDVLIEDGLGFFEVETRPCVPSDFYQYNGTTYEESSLFYPTKALSQGYLDQYGVGRMRCFAEPEK